MKIFRKIVLLFSIIGVIDVIWFLMDDTWNALIPMIAAPVLIPTVCVLNLVEILASTEKNKPIGNVAIISRSICLLMLVLAVRMYNIMSN